jgi:hypothetical protein
MALPKLTVTPNYELVVPSTKETVRFRPFLVKEQKVLLIASESQDRRQIIRAMLDTIQSCVEEEIDVSKLTTFDVDYMFMQMRAKSVGEKIKVNLQCSNCEATNEVDINLEDVKLEVEESEKTVQITDTVSVKLSYPTYFRFIKDNVLENIESQSEVLMEIIVSCIDAVITEEEYINARDESREELVQFVESMTADQFEEISGFVQNIPVLRHNVEYNCLSCNTHNEFNLEGLEDFF